MGITKTDNFNERQNQLALVLKALGHPARVAIVEYLLTVESCVCGDIVNELPLAQPTISQHLKELKNVGIIKGTIEGTSVCYCLNQETFTELEQYFNEMNKKMKMKGECC
jgi:ArsR family transcriptional regulator